MRLNIAKSERGVFEIKKTEEHIVKEIIQMLELNGAHVDRLVERIPWGRKTSTPGIPDLCVRFPINHPASWESTLDPVQAWIEVKVPGGHRRPAQVAWIEQAQRDGVLATFAESWGDVVRYFEGHGIVLKIK